jgi:hypothetical protein
LTYSNTDYRICVYQSPERYDDYHRESVEIPHPNSQQHLYTLDSYINEHGTVPNEPILRTIRLQRFWASLHVSYEMLRDFGLDFRTLTLNSIAQNQNAQALLLTIFQTVSRETDRRLREERGIPEHTIILDKVEIIIQQETNRLLVDMVFYACQHQDTDLGLRYFQDNLQRLMYNTRRTLHSDGRIEVDFSETLQEIEHNRDWLGGLQVSPTCYIAVDYDERFLGKWATYDQKAEERALKLLESMLSKGEFEIYTKDGYVMVEGKTHKMYKVRKNSMIEVSEKQKDNLYKTYRLCIEPKNHGTICPTDEVVAKVKLIQADEDKLHKIAKRFDNK